MPDWTYHPLFRPLLFRLAPETSRRLVLGALELQGRFAAGRRLFRWFARAPVAPELTKDVLGLRFPAPIGLGPHIDADGTSLAVMPMLGFGFIVLGPAGAGAIERAIGTEPLRLEDPRAIVSSGRAGAPSAATIARHVRALPEPRACPIGLALRGDELARAIADADADLDFFTLPFDVARDASALGELRRATKKPLLLRLPPHASDDALERATDAAVLAKLDGVIATTGAACDLLPDGELEHPGLVDEALRVVRFVAARHGARLAIVGGGGVATPDDARRFLDAGASLVEIRGGLVYAGPGFPARVVRALRSSAPRTPSTSPTLEPATSTPSLGLDASSFGPLLVALTGLVLIAAGLFALVLAATVKLLPYDVAFLGMSMQDLCARNACRIVHFMAHDRVSFGGSIISIGSLYVWLGLVPLRRGEAWAFWTLVFSSVIGFGSFLTYLGYGYLDVWHGRATLALLPIFGLGLARSYARLKGPRGPSEVLKKGVGAWIWSPGGMGRAALTFSAFGMISGGVLIMCVGMTRVFVPQDLEFMGATAAELHALNPRLVPLIAHDRAGFGGGLASTGIAVMMILIYGLRPGERALWWALSVAGLVGFGCAIGVHPIVGYTSFVHLAPAYAGALAFLVAAKLLYRPLVRSAPATRFPDL